MTVEYLEFNRDVLQDWFDSHPLVTIKYLLVDTGRILIVYV